MRLDICVTLDTGLHPHASGANNLVSRYAYETSEKITSARLSQDNFEKVTAVSKAALVEIKAILEASEAKEGENANG